MELEQDDALTSIAITAMPNAPPHQRMSNNAGDFAGCLANTDASSDKIAEAAVNTRTHTQSAKASSNATGQHLAASTAHSTHPSADQADSKTATKAKSAKKDTDHKKNADDSPASPPDTATALPAPLMIAQDTPQPLPTRTAPATTAEPSTPAGHITASGQDTAWPNIPTASDRSGTTTAAEADQPELTSAADSSTQALAATDLAAGLTGNVTMPTLSQPTITHSATGNTTATLAVPQAGTAMVSLLQTPTNGPQVILHLAPEALGALTVTISRDDNGQTSVTFSATEPDTLHALASNQHDLHALIQDAGLPAENHKLHFELAEPQAVSPAAPADAGNSTGFSSTQSGLNDSFTHSEQNTNASPDGQTGAWTGDGMSDGGWGSERNDGQRRYRTGAGKRGDDTIERASMSTLAVRTIRPVNITV